MTDYHITGKCPACEKVATFEYNGEVSDGEDWVVKLYTCLECGTTRSRSSIVAATTGQQKKAA